MCCSQLLIKGKEKKEATKEAGLRDSSSQSISNALGGAGLPLPNQTVYEASRTPRSSPDAYVRKRSFAAPLAISALPQFSC